MRPSPGSEPERPFVVLAAALGAGTWLGLAAGEGERVLAGALLAAVVLAAVALARLSRAPRWAAWIAVAAFARASAIQTPVAEPLGAVEASRARAEAIAGVFRAERAGRSGWIEPFGDGGPLGDANGSRPPLLVEPAGVAPEDGTPVVLLAGGEVQPWARGPARPSGSRARRFAALATPLADELVRVGSAPRRPWDGLAERLAELRIALAERVRTLERERSAGLLVALAVGDRDGIASERVDLLVRTGTAHLLALSGWHVGLFALLVLKPLARARRPGAAGFAVQTVLLVVFAALAGAEKPIVRAVVALLLAELAALAPRGAIGPGGPGAAGAAPRRPDSLSFLAAAFALECVLDPSGIRSLSLGLSYGATLGLVLGTGAFTEVLRGLLRGPRPRFAPIAPGAPGAPGLAVRAVRLVAAKLADGFVRGLAASAAAVLATLPLAWTTFGELAPAGILLTVLVMPAFTLLSVLAWIGALAPIDALAPVAELGAHAFYLALELGDALPGTPLVLPPRPLALLAVACALPFLVLERRGLARRGRSWPGRLACLLWAALLVPWTAAPRGLELVALDVGHGTSVVARAPGLEALVFDAGSRDRRGVAGEALIPLLASWDVARPAVVLSHVHLDHASGLARLAERYPLAAWLGPARSDVRLPHGIPSADLALGRLAVATACPALSLALLRGSDERGNEGSRALELGWRGERVLLLGDAEEEGLTGLPLAPGPLRLLLAPHHGADAPGLSPLLARHPPAEVWISASRRAAIEPELDRRRLPWRSTARDGFLALGLR